MQELKTGTRLQGGRYTIERTLGQGGFGITYLGVQSGLHREVAIKEFFMKDYCGRDASASQVTLGTEGSRQLVARFREKFLKEARNIAELDHPNIVPIYDVFEENGTAYYVMKYATGGSLASKVKREGHLQEEVATEYILQVASALYYIHQRKMAHLDVKPANIMLDQNGNALLIDFGISKQYDGLTGEQTSTNQVGISPGFSPMEQYEAGGVGRFSPESDIYSLGATFYCLLTGYVPPSATEVLNNGLPMSRLHTLGVSQCAIHVIRSAMEPRRMDRMKSVDEFFDALQSNDDSTDVAESRSDDDEATRVISSMEGNARGGRDGDVQTFEVNGISFDMVLVKAGTFTMGATPEMKEPFDWEKPAHKVTLTKDYYMGRTEVTQALWQAVMGSNPSHFKDLSGSQSSFWQKLWGSKSTEKSCNLPVEQVSWDDCQQFIKKLNALTGKNFRLPTEAEWEFAARGGNQSQHFQYSGSNNLDDVAWYDGNSNSEPHPVGTKQPNELGLYDMSGNVWEWCNDWYEDYSSDAQTDPKGPSNGSYRVFRGGGWGDVARDCRSSIRIGNAPDFSCIVLGLRLALSE